MRPAALVTVLALQAGLRATSARSYTAHNLCLLGVLGVSEATGVLADQLRELWPAALCGTLSLNATFYFLGTALDPGFFPRMRAHNGWAVRTFVAGDILVHVLPSALLAANAVARPGAWRRLLGGSPLFAVEAAYMSLSWSALTTGGSFDLSTVYVPVTPRHWACAWAFSLLVQALVGAALSAWCAAHGTPL
jgi:hypothetical protein